MSSTLMWRPYAPQEQAPLPDELKRALSREVWDTDGSTGGEERIVDANILPYLRGLRDAGVPGAEELISLIQQHGQVVLWHEH